MNVEMGVLHLVLEASIVVQAVMAILLIASLIVWTLIFAKRKELKKATKKAKEFEDQFWSGQDLNDLYNRLTARPDARPEGMEYLFVSGYKEFLFLQEKPHARVNDIVDGVQRNMRLMFNRQAEALENHLPLLATIGSSAPYIGLFGTVWGIMNAFQGLATVQHATISMVAPGISEALIATAMGLFAAIPAVIAYNRLSVSTEKLLTRYEMFSEEFINLVQRKMHEVER